VSTPEDLSISWQDLLEALPDGTALIDVHGVMHYANAELAYLTGYTHDELVGQNVQMLILRFCVRWRERRDDSTRKIQTPGSSGTIEN